MYSLKVPIKYFSMNISAICAISNVLCYLLQHSLVQRVSSDVMKPLILSWVSLFAKFQKYQNIQYSIQYIFDEIWSDGEYSFGVNMQRLKTYTLYVYMLLKLPNWHVVVIKIRLLCDFAI